MCTILRQPTLEIVPIWKIYIHPGWGGKRRTECKLYKSGIYNLNTGVDFDIELIEAENGDKEYTGGKDF